MSKFGVVINGVFPRASCTSIKEFKKSCINATYDVKLKNPSKQVVLRMFPKDGWKAQKEEYLYSLIKKKTNVPIPKVFHTGKDYLILSRILGKNLSGRNRKLIRKAGEILARIHSIKFNSYGWIVGRDIKPKFSNWEKFMVYDVDHKLKKLNGFVKEGLITKSRAYFDKNRDLLKIKSKPSLLHKDYHYSHIIVHKGKISGIIDFEWAIAGHNELDLAKSILWMFEKDEKGEKIFLEGYKKYGTISKDFEERKELYSMLLEISSLWFSYELKNKKWCNYNLKKITKFLKNG